MPKVRLIGSNGTNLGVIDTREAMDMARREHLDLIEVAPNSDPPVCRIFDYGKFSYEREKKEREAKKTQRTFELKGVRLRPKTTDYHLYFKMREARRFLEQGNKVKVTLKFRGREDRLLHVARRMLDKVAEGCADLALLEAAPNMEGKTMLVVLAPTQATLANAHLKTTQDRVERELKSALGADGYKYLLKGEVAAAVEVRRARVAEQAALAARTEAAKARQREG